MSFWVYILRCADGSYYTGHTDDLEKRVGEHTAGAERSAYTFARRPVELVFADYFDTRDEALVAELRIKAEREEKGSADA